MTISQRFCDGNRCKALDTRSEFEKTKEGGAKYRTAAPDAGDLPGNFSAHASVPASACILFSDRSRETKWRHSGSALVKAALDGVECEVSLMQDCVLSSRQH